MATYNGNIFGDRRLFVFSRASGTGAAQVNFVKTIPALSSLAGSTTAYVSAGGPTYGTTAELLPFFSNRAYEQYARSETRVLTTLSESGGITSSIVTFTPDPRSHIGIYASGPSLQGLTGNHMDEIHITAKNGNTYQAFLGRQVYNEQDPSVGVTMSILELVAYGVSGASDPSSLYDLQTGKTLANKTNGTTGAVATTRTLRFVDINSHKQAIEGQMISSLEQGGMTGCTIGDATHAQNVFFRSSDPRLINFVSTLLPAFAQGGTGISGSHDTRRQEQIFTLLAGATAGPLTDVADDGDDAIYGVTFDAVNGGTLPGQSAFEEFAHVVLHTHAASISARDALIMKLRSAKSIRDVDDISF